METLQPPYHMYNMVPNDPNDTERIEPEDAEVIRIAYPEINVRKIFTKICWSPKDKLSLMLRCKKILYSKFHSRREESDIRATKAREIRRKQQIETGEKKAEIPIWNEEDINIMKKIFRSSEVDRIINRQYWIEGEKEHLINYCYETDYYQEQEREYYNQMEQAKQDSRDHDDYINDCRDQARDMGYDV